MVVSPGVCVVRSKGVVAEFVRPQYAGKGMLAFKAPARLECLMQAR